MTLQRAQTLISLGRGMVNLDAYEQLRRHAASGGWAAVTDWLDGITAAAQDPAVADLATKRADHRAGGV